MVASRLSSRLIPILHAIAAAGLAIWLLVVIAWPWLGEEPFALAQNFEQLCRNYFCHRMPSRSLSINGLPLLVCARCTGVIAGYLIGAVAALCSAERLPIWRIPFALLLIACMGLSWLGGQYDLLQEQWHAERVVAGALGGLGGYIFIARSVVLTLHWWQRRQASLSKEAIV